MWLMVALAWREDALCVRMCGGLCVWVEWVDERVTTQRRRHQEEEEKKAVVLRALCWVSSRCVGW